MVRAIRHSPDGEFFRFFREFPVFFKILMFFPQKT
jgi:hypothetical protein